MGRTALLAASATGEKLKPIVIGKAENPRSVRGMDKALHPVTYRANKKARHGWRQSFFVNGVTASTPRWDYTTTQDYHVCGQLCCPSTHRDIQCKTGISATQHVKMTTMRCWDHRSSESSIPETSLTPLARQHGRGQRSDRAIKACGSERCNWLVEPSLGQCHRILHCEMFCKMRVYCSRSGWMSRGWHSIGKFTISHGWYHMGGIW